MRRLLTLTALLLLTAPAAAQAATGSAVFGMRGVPNPKLGYFVYSLGPGSSKTGSVLVTNNGKAAGTVTLHAADATTGQTSGTVYLTDRKPARAGSWITLDAPSLTLKPGAHKLVHFTVHVPAGASPGQWVAGLVAETSRLEHGKRTKRKASVQVNIRSQTILAVQVNVPGPTAAKVTIGKVAAGGTRGYQQVLIRLANVGNAMAKPKGSVTITDAKGATVEQVPFTMDTFLPKTAIDYPVVLKKALGPGQYQASVTLTYPGASGSETASAKPAFEVTKQNVQQVFTSTSPTQTAPGTAASSSGKSSNNTMLLIGVLVVGGLILAALVVLIFTRRKPA